VPYVRVIGTDKRPIGIMPTREAVTLARNQNLDLVMLAPNEDPPVCGILDFGRYMYEQKAKLRESKKKQHQTEVREMRMKIKIDTHDYEVKLRKMREFLEEKDRIRLTLWLRGREILHQDIAFRLLERVSSDLAAVGRFESAPKVTTEGRKSIQVMLVPR
jgi:translation initiation factor IF-3